MTHELTVPEVGESISEVQIGRWLKQSGEPVGKDEDLVEIETEKASVLLPAPEAGTLEILRPEGEFAAVGEVIGRIVPGSAADAPAPTADAADAEAPTVEPEPDAGAAVMPSAARLLQDHGLEASQVRATGPGGRLLKEDVLRHVEQEQAREAARAALVGVNTSAGTAAAPAPPRPAGSHPPGDRPAAPATPGGDRHEELRPMSMLRRTIAARLVQAQQQAALLTTFNEIDMQPVMELRRRHQEQFQTAHGVRLGFMSFFVKASVAALRRVPSVNAEVRDNDVVYRDYHDIGVAIGGGKGLVVPVLRNAERLSFAEIERAIADLAERAQANRIQPDELAGGTFTISNGGIYGSLLSTPIVNPPQSGILGMHSIQERPVVRDGAIVARPMMYVALTYDHRIIDGREAVTFLKTVKEVLEEPARLFLEI